MARRKIIYFQGLDCGMTLWEKHLFDAWDGRITILETKSFLRGKAPFSLLQDAYMRHGFGENTILAGTGAGAYAAMFLAEMYRAGGLVLLPDAKDGAAAEYKTWILRKQALRNAFLVICDVLVICAVQNRPIARACVKNMHMASASLLCCGEECVAEDIWKCMDDAMRLQARNFLSVLNCADEIRSGTVPVIPPL